MDKNYDVITFISKKIISRRPRIANFADVIKTATIFIKAIFKDSKKLKNEGESGKVKHELRVKIHKLRVQNHKLRVQIHELED